MAANNNDIDSFMDRYATDRPQSGRQQPAPQRRRPAPKKRKTSKIAPFLCVLLVLAIGATGFFAKGLEDKKKENAELQTQMDSVNAELTTAKAQAQEYKDSYGELNLPKFDGSAIDFDEKPDEAMAAYEAALADADAQFEKIDTKVAALREEYAAIEAQNPDPDDPNRKVAYLTFDDGPSENTLKVLKILKEYNAKATFFVIGEANLDYTKNIIADGHVVALHTDTHEYGQIYRSTDAFFKDLDAISKKVEKACGVKSMLTRFPGGSSNTISKNWAQGIMTELTEMIQDKGYKYFDWNVDSGDASGMNVPASTIVSNVKSQSSGVNRICVLFHDTAAKNTTVEALPEIMEYLKSEGYAFEVLKKTSDGFHMDVNN